MHTQPRQNAKQTNHQRLQQIARQRPQVVLGVLSYWLGAAKPAAEKR